MMGQEHLYPQTPMFRALQSDRYARQDAIRDIQEKTHRTLLVYEANIWSANSMLGTEDVQPFGDLLSRVPHKQKNVDLLLQSPGGDIDAAEKIVYMCRDIAQGFRVIVPEYAKSAATLIALASDEVVMGLASELGPIDAQLTAPGPGGARFQTSAQSFIDEFDRVKQEVTKTGTLSPAYFPLLDGLNLGFMGMCRNLMARSERFAVKWLKKYMLKDAQEKAEELAKQLCDVKRWLTHGQVIDADEAERLGIKVCKLGQDDPLWERVWYLHCCYGVLFRQTQTAKIFESEVVSLPFR
jgi:hypothetical protein